MKRHLTALGALAMSAALLGAPNVYANDPAAAEALFKKGKQLMADGSYDDACEAFEESMKLDPGVGTKYKLGTCYEKQGRNASAWSAYLEAASLAKAAGQTDRAKAARAKADALEPALSKLTVQAPTDAPEDLSVTIRDTDYGSATFGTAIPFDPGTHEASANASGFQSWNGSVTVPGDAGSVTLTIPSLTPEVVEKRVPMPGDRGNTGNGDGNGTLLWVGVAGIGLGVGAMAGGGVWIGLEVADENAARDEFYEISCSDPDCAANEDEYVVFEEREADVVPGAILLGGGALLAGAGIVMVALSAGDDEDVLANDQAASVDLYPLVGLGYVGVRGTF